MRSGRFSSQLNGRAEVNRQRNRKGATREFLGEFLGLNPGSTGPQIIAAGGGRHPPPAFLFCGPQKRRSTPPTGEGRYLVAKKDEPPHAPPPPGEHTHANVVSFFPPPAKHKQAFV